MNEWNKIQGSRDPQGIMLMGGQKKAFQTEELMKAITERDKTFEEIMQFIGKGNGK